LSAVNTTIDYKTDTKCLIFCLFASHYMFGSVEIIIRWSTNFYLLLENYLLKAINFFYVYQ
jgi:hypothetical protein